MSWQYIKVQSLPPPPQLPPLTHFRGGWQHQFGRKGHEFRAQAGRRSRSGRTFGSEQEFVEGAEHRLEGLPHLGWEDAQLEGKAVKYRKKGEEK